jgi:hypothetical protein
MTTVQRALYAYSIHGRGQNGVIDYAALMEALARAPDANRQATIRDETIAITRIQERLDGLWVLRFVAGTEASSQAFFDPTTGQESERPGPSGLIQVRPTLVFVNPQRQLVVIERKQYGLTAPDIAKATGAIGREIRFSAGLIINLNPVTAESFLAELEGLDRIRKAAVMVTRPNWDWTDNATKLTEYAQESDGQTAEVEISAPRGGSLAHNSGIVGDIKALVSQTIAPLKKVRVVGNQTGESKERTVSLSQHQERLYAKFDSDEATSDQESSMAEAAVDLMARLDPVDPADDGR